MSLSLHDRLRRRRGFVLLEAMLAVFIFALGVIALGQCIQNCLNADRIKEEDTRARRALENAMALIEAGAVIASDSATEDLKGMFQGMRLKTSKTPLKEKNEKGEDIFGISLVKLEVTWTSGAEKISREMFFYNYPRQR